MRKTPLFALLAGLMFVSCGGAPETGASEGQRPGEVGNPREVAGGSYSRVSPEELRDIKDEGDVLLVNTHIPFEGDIPGTDLSIPYDEIGASVEDLPDEEDARIVLYCMTGPMSTEAAEDLVKRGYTNILELDGGMRAWQNAGLPLEGT